MLCIIIEDQPPAQRILKTYINTIQTLNLAGTFNTVEDALVFLKTSSVDLIFLDIHLPQKSGLEFLKAKHTTAAVILTTAFVDYALEGYEHGVIDYLLKPFSLERFKKAIAKLPQHTTQNTLKPAQTATKNYTFIKVGYELVKINFSEISHIQSDNNYTDVFTSTQKLTSPEPLKFWEDVLEAQPFIRVHKSYIINTNTIAKIIGNRIVLNNAVHIPIGRKFKDNVMAVLLQ